MHRLQSSGLTARFDGDPPAAMRYTESRMTKAAQYLLADIDKDTVQFQDTYDGVQQEPMVLPAQYPNLLVNGGGGIAVGMATNIPPHNLGEVVDATLAMIDEPGIDDEALLEIVPGPDFPTGGLILGYAGSRKALLEGRGSVLMRARTEIEEVKSGRQAIIVSEIPYQVNKASMVQKIAELVRDKRIEGIVGNNFSSYVRDYDFSVLLQEHNKGRSQFTIPDRFGELHGKLFKDFVCSDTYKANFNKPPVICLSVSDNKTYERTENQHPILGVEFFGDLPTDYTNLELIGTISTMETFQKIYRPEIYNANAVAGNLYKPNLRHADHSITQIVYDREERSQLAVKQGKFAEEHFIKPYQAVLQKWFENYAS